jgi:YHS domain-containing protein
MKKTIEMVTAALAVLATAGVAVSAFAGEDVASATPSAVKAQTLCPVMGGKVNPALFVDYQGKRIYVCCQGCVDEVKKDPAKYIAKLDADGITIEKTPAATNAPASTSHQGIDEPKTVSRSASPH